MEGISQEAIALAGHLKLNKLILFWDNNSITIDGAVSLSDSTDQIARFKAVHWNTIEVDGHDPEAIAAAIEAAHKSDRPTLIAAKTIIGFGAPHKGGTHKVHGSPLGAEEIAATRVALNWPSPTFEIPQDILDMWRQAGQRGASVHKEWENRLAASATKTEFDRRFAGDLPAGFAPAVTAYKQKLAETKPTVATRKASEDALEIINGILPETLGGSADLTPSNNTKTSQMKEISPVDFSGRYMHWGIREHGMAAAMNGIALHGGLLPYGGGFLIFSDYCRPPIRLASLMGIRVVHVLTHDSIGLGEDGPTHQPVEQLAALRAIPNMVMLRPADAMETMECWEIAVSAKDHPTGLALTRQNLIAARTSYSAENLSARGAYVLHEDAKAQVSIFASGSEVEIALKAKELLAAKGIAARIVSVPGITLFEKQPADYQAAVIGTAKVKVGIEAAIRQGWDYLIGNDGIFVGMKSFGASAPYKALYEYFGITPEAVAEAVAAKLA